VPREAIRARGRRDYYSFGGTVVAMKDGVMNAAPRTLTYLHGDHLGSASLTTNANGQKVSEQRYKPYGEVRWASGPGMPTDKQFTSQTRLIEGYVGTLYDYVARAYDPVLGRFISADTIVPGAGNGQAFNRYSYALNSPLRYADPSGHRACNDSDDCESPEGRPDRVTAPSVPLPGWFYKMSVAIENVDWIQWHGNTEFAHKSGSIWSYDAYSQGFHAGIDFGSRPGTPVRAGVYGKVTQIWIATYYKPSYVVVTTGDIEIYYGHLDIPMVKLNAEVTPESIMGGVASDLGHTHIEVRSATKLGTELLNPLSRMPPNFLSQLGYVAKRQVESNLNVNEATFHIRSDGAWVGPQNQPVMQLGGPNLQDQFAR